MRWSETKNLKNLIINNFLLPLNGNKTLYSYITRNYIVKNEVKMPVTVNVSMVTV